MWPFHHLKRNIRCHSIPAHKRHTREITRHTKTNWYDWFIMTFFSSSSFCRRSRRHQCRNVVVMCVDGKWEYIFFFSFVHSLNLYVCYFDYYPSFSVTHTQKYECKMMVRIPCNVNVWHTRTEWIYWTYTVYLVYMKIGWFCIYCKTLAFWLCSCYRIYSCKSHRTYWTEFVMCNGMRKNLRWLLLCRCTIKCRMQLRTNQKKLSTCHIFFVQFYISFLSLNTNAIFILSTNQTSSRSRFYSIRNEHKRKDTSFVFLCSLYFSAIQILRCTDDH